MARCDQVEDPALATGIVKREVTETVTPGTVLADNLLAERRNNFLVALVQPSADVFALAALDVSTGELTAQMVPAHELRAELGRIEPTELLLPRSLEQEEELDAAAPVVPRTVRDDWMFEADVATDELLRVYRLQSLDGFGFEPGDEPLIRATGGLVHYLKEVRPGGVTHLQPPRLRRPGRVMLLDEMTRRNLELIEPPVGGAACYADIGIRPLCEPFFDLIQVRGSKVEASRSRRHAGKLVVWGFAVRVKGEYGPASCGISSCRIKDDRDGHESPPSGALPFGRPRDRILQFCELHVASSCT